MPATVFVVEDSPVIGARVKKILERNVEGVQLLCASDGKEGFEMLRDYSPDVVILDWMMPDFFGSYFLEKQREAPDVADVPVILHSALGREQLGSELEDFDSVKSFLQKPVLPKKLFEQLRPFLE